MLKQPFVALFQITSEQLLTIVKDDDEELAKMTSHFDGVVTGGALHTLQHRKKLKRHDFKKIYTTVKNKAC